MSAAFTQVADSIGTDSATQPVDPLLQASRHADFQANAAMAMAKALKKNPREIATAVIEAVAANELIDQLEIAGPGFINITLAPGALGGLLAEQRADALLGFVPPSQQTIVIDYSAPNVAKEMHVGHLRSTIIGDACVRLLEWQGHNVIRRNHLGDWGTPFGMLIEHLLDMGETEATQELSQGDLNGFYRAARQKFADSEEFQTRARNRVVSLQSGDVETLRLWKLLIEQSQKYFMQVYAQLEVRLDGSEFVGESAYNDELAPTLEALRSLGLIQTSDGAECLFPPGFTNRDNEPLPLIVRKRDGGYGYAATDLAALRQRTQTLNADRLLYVVGSPQSQHLEMVYEAGRMAGWLQAPATAEHIAFGSVLGSDGKMFKSRTGDTVRLSDLVNEAIDRAAATIEAKNPELSAEERVEVAQMVGIGAVKYADLSSERTRDYVFDFDRMLALEGNTAPYMQYAYARVQSIVRRAMASHGIDAPQIDQAPMIIVDEAEKLLAMQLLRFADVVEDVSDSLLFHRLATYLFDLATAYSGFYNSCPVVDAPDAETRLSRLALCRLTARTLATGLSLLGIRAPEKM
ncbi:arginine--tRNA ligase [Granulosicoccus antarcticus]|uniref:Arginine--tRNA ligase n=1 Tax=Granulosicoccus antarcticus IMCC3135 TaxID=1192854 RepID=A0A2Z2NU49_9GAMM|nr:arginine--tRNA ligase [Granulosicoccus antarcticus]ASJ70634.1 Arginine--tRNA ligase [Granulosicoccus antarcticus IMCC3135]